MRIERLTDSLSSHLDKAVTGTAIEGFRAFETAFYDALA
jgi:hypothetical protein